MNRRKTIAAAAAAVTAASAGYVLWANKAVTTTNITVTSPALPPAFDGFRIAHISDLHNDELGKNHRDLVRALQKAQPDIIAITGDMIDARRTNIPCALRFAKQALEIAPCYYVMGNHEARIPVYPELEHGLVHLGVTVLRNDTATLQRGDAAITMIGLDDPSITPNFHQILWELAQSTENFKLLLCHRPEEFHSYCKANIHLALCGHAHGGQVRIPFVGGVIAPHQGWFPYFDSGLYTYNQTNMIVSRGLGNSLCPLRVNNRPELVIATLKSQQ